MPKITLDDRLYSYLLNNSLREPDLFAELHTQATDMGMPDMNIQPEQGQFFQLLVKLMGAKLILEVGTFIGYSALWFASALPDDGKLITCDIKKEWCDIAKQHWKRAGLDQKITCIVQDAKKTLAKLTQEQQRFDIIFIDADKTGYDDYYEQSLKLIQPKGLIIIDNVLFHNKVADPENQTDRIKALRAINKKIHQDDRVTISMIPVGDGMTLIMKR